MPLAAALPARNPAAVRFGLTPVLRLLVVVLLALGVGSVGLATAPTASAASGRLTAFDDRMLVLVNNARDAAGLPDVESATGLVNLSVWWSSQMADGATGDVLQHNPNAFKQTLTYGASNRTAWAENVAKWSPATLTADQIFDKYMASPGHKANILGSAYRYIGIGSVTGSNGASYDTMTFTDKVDPGQVYVPPKAVGSADSVTITNGTVRAAGWAYDPAQSATSVPVLLYVNSVLYQSNAANSRSDVNAAFNIAGNHGFDITAPAVIGNNTICLYAASVTGQGYTGLYCATLNRPAPTPPTGQVEIVMMNGSTVGVGGWGYDPNTPNASIQVQININGAYGTTVNTDGTRADINSARGISGNHGFTAYMPTNYGPNRVCVWLISKIPDNNKEIGCWTVTNNIAPPNARLDSMTRSGGNVRITGWAYDPQASSTSIPMHVYVNGNGAVFSTTASRGDVNGTYGITGTHGFDTTFAAPSGANVCVYAISVSGGANTGLSCRTI